MTMTPFDFAVLTGLDVGGWSIPYDEDMGEWEAAWTYLLGAHPPIDRVSGRVRYTWFSSHFRRAEMVPETPEETEQYARGFLMFLFGTTLFADRGNTVGLYLLSALVDLSQVHRYDWGGAGLATLYFYMSATSRGRGDLLGSYWRAWESVFCSQHFVLAFHTAFLTPELEVVGIPVTPYSLIFEGPNRPRPRETLLRLRQYFDTVRHSEITWQPWVSLGDGLRLQYTGASDISQYRVLLEGPVGRVWFLGERFLRQVWGYLSQDIPAVPPASMRTADRLSYSEDQARARAADAPSTSRAGTSRGGSRPVPLAPSIHPHPGWPDMPTELMAWQYGASSPTLIPLEPPMPSDRYAIDPDSPPPSRGYMEEVVGLVATLEGMVLRREAQLFAPAVCGDMVLPVRGIGMPSSRRVRTLMAALVERWWDTTNSFHFSATGDMTMTPFDFAVLTGLDVGGWSIPYDEDMGEWEAAWTYLLGAHPPVDRVSGRVRYTWFSSHFRRAEMYARGFLMFLFGTTLFADRGNTVGLYLLSALVDLSQVHRYDWGGAGLATLYFYMSATSRGRGDLLGSYWRAWE
ncbi:hypothetical protein CsSME_00033876 [Camellia sinensis var. sinensis]